MSEPLASRPLVIIPCGGSKLAGRHRARDLYTGGYFAACLRYALRVTGPEDVRILSARYGLVRLDEPVDSYELRLGQPGAVSTHSLTVQARAQGIAGSGAVIALGGKAYTAAARTVWPHAVNPIEGLPGIGYQLQALKALTAASGPA